MFDLSKLFIAYRLLEEMPFLQFVFFKSKVKLLYIENSDKL